jgi:hypothetical protein
MRLICTALILAAASCPGLSRSQPASVDVYINSHDASSQLLGPGTPLASDLFKRIGVRLNWHSGEPPAGRSAFAIRTEPRAPGSASPEALAASRLSGSSTVEITVYSDRVRHFLDVHRSLAGVATGYVLAHELAHVVQGVARHSNTGIMKAHWSAQDFHEMVFHKLAFAPIDVELIHQGLAIR